LILDPAQLMGDAEDGADADKDQQDGQAAAETKDGAD
jgi:hypothetical protein